MSNGVPSAYWKGKSAQPEVGLIATRGRSRTAETGSNVWLRPRKPERADPPLTQERIVAGAVELLDEEGIDRLTMRRLAERLGAGAPTLYWHVATKDDVIDLAVDAIFGETGLPSRGGTSWRQDVVALLSSWRRTMLRHPWSAALPSRQRPLLGPSFLAWMEFLQSALVRAGFRGQDLGAATWLLYNHVMGSSAGQSSLQLSTDERRLGQDRLREQAEVYPTLAEHDFLLDDAWDEDFAIGLEIVLDGLEVRRRPG